MIASCEITGSSDSSIRNVTPNDLSVILSTANIRQIFVNGGTAAKYYDYTESTLSRMFLASKAYKNADKEHNDGKWNKEIADADIYAWKASQKK